MRKLHRKIKGFTLIELVVTLLIGVLLLAWGVPNFRDLKMRRAVNDFSNEMVYSFSLARAEAVRYGRTVTVDPEGDWSTGWLISTPGIDGIPTIEIYRQDITDDKFSLTQQGSLQGPVQFNSFGALTGTDEGRFLLEYQGAASEDRIVRITLSGLTRVERP